MKNEIFLSSKQQKDVSGTANVLIDGLAPFNGVIETFSTKDKKVFVSANQQFDAIRSGALTFRFMANITNGKHDYEAGSGLSVTYSLRENFGGLIKITPYPAVYGSGAVNVTFDSAKGTLAVGFELEVQNNPTEPKLKAIGAFRDVSGLVDMNK